jgi:HSP20 family protein
MMNELQNFMEELNNMFYTDGGYKSFPVDVTLENNTYKVYAEIPGVAKEDIKLSFENGTLTITCNPKKEKKEKYLVRERTNQKYQRELYFGDINEDSIQAKYDLGVLEVTITLKEKEKKSIEIN